MSTVLIAQFCNNAFKEAERNFHMKYLTMRLLELWHAIC